MLATSVEDPFDDPAWLYEIKWDGYRAVAFIEKGKLRLVSRNQNDLTAQFGELQAIPKFVKAKTAVLDGEIVALDADGRASFSLMQQRTGIRYGASASREILRYKFSITPSIFFISMGMIFVACHWSSVNRRWRLVVVPEGILRVSDHFDKGKALFAAAKKQGLEGILAKKRDSCYEEKRTRDWLKIKITDTVDCVIGGYTEPEGTRQYFGSIVLGMYNKKKQLIHVGQAGTGFTYATLKDHWKKLEKLKANINPFHGHVEALRKVHWVKPELVAEIKFTEWTHESAEGGMKLRAPVFLRLRDDKKPEECVLEQ